MLNFLLSGALKLVGEAFPWQDGSQFVYTQDNHNSVLGIRELALDHGAAASCVEINSGKGVVCCMLPLPYVEEQNLLNIAVATEEQGAGKLLLCGSS